MTVSSGSIARVRRFCSSWRPASVQCLRFILAMTHFNTFNGLEEEWKYAIRKSVNNPELRGAVNTLKGRNTTQKVFKVSERSGLNFLLKVSVFMFLFVSSTKANCNASTLKLLLNAWLFLIFNGMHFLLFWVLKMKTTSTCVNLKYNKSLFWNNHLFLQIKKLAWMVLLFLTLNKAFKYNEKTSNIFVHIKFFPLFCSGEIYLAVCSKSKPRLPGSWVTAGGISWY